VLAKLVGFYTVEVRNLDSGMMLHKADLVVMENLFFDRKIEKMFDLKGIQACKVKAKDVAEAPKTLFNEEWMEGELDRRSFASGPLMCSIGQQRGLMLACPPLEGRAGGEHSERHGLPGREQRRRR
jgi:hypothetical protein